MGYFAEGDVVFELGDIIPEWEVFRNGSGGELYNSFVLDINMDKRCFEVSLEGNPCSKRWSGEREGFLGEGGCPDSGRSFLHKG